MNNRFLDLFIGKEKEEKEITNKTLIVKNNRCPQNHPCPSVGVCPVGALSQKGFSAPTVNLEKCINCGKCIKSCPMRAITFG